MAASATDPFGLAQRAPGCDNRGSAEAGFHHHQSLRRGDRCADDQPARASGRPDRAGVRVVADGDCASRETFWSAVRRHSSRVSQTLGADGALVSSRSVVRIRGGMFRQGRRRRRRRPRPRPSPVLRPFSSPAMTRASRLERYALSRMKLAAKGRYAPPPPLPAHAQSVSDTLARWPEVDAHTHWRSTARRDFGGGAPHLRALFQKRRRKCSAFGRVSASKPSALSVTPRPESFTPVHGSAGSSESQRFM